MDGFGFHWSRCATGLRLGVLLRVGALIGLIGMLLGVIVGGSDAWFGFTGFLGDLVTAVALAALILVAVGGLLLAVAWWTVRRQPPQVPRMRPRHVTTVVEPRPVAQVCGGCGTQLPVGEDAQAAVCACTVAAMVAPIPLSEKAGR